MKWTEDKVELLKANYGKVSWEELERLFGLTRSTLSEKASRLGITKNRARNWEKWEDDFLRQRAVELGWAEVAERLDRTESSVKNRYHILTSHKEHRGISDGQIEWLIGNYANSTTAEICSELGCDAWKVRELAEKFGLRKSRAFVTKWRRHYEGIVKNYGK